MNTHFKAVYTTDLTLRSYNNKGWQTLCFNILGVLKFFSHICFCPVTFKEVMCWTRAMSLYEWKDCEQYQRSHSVRQEEYTNKDNKDGAISTCKSLQPCKGETWTYKRLHNWNLILTSKHMYDWNLRI